MPPEIYHELERFDAGIILILDHLMYESFLFVKIGHKSRLGLSHQTCISFLLL